MLEEYAPWVMEDLVGPHAQGRAYYMRPAERPQSVDEGYRDSAEFWHDVINEQIGAERVVKLSGFKLFDWVPRNPGLYHTGRAKSARHEAQNHVLSSEHIWTRGGSRSDPSALFRTVTSAGSRVRTLLPTPSPFQTTRTILYAPVGKVAMLSGGVGCVRYKPIELKSGGMAWLMSASSELAPDTGVPLMVSDELYQRLADGLHDAGGIECDIVGRTRFVSNQFRDLFSIQRGIPRLYIDVKEIRPRRNIRLPAEVSVAVSFFSRFEGVPKIYAAYVTFDPKQPGARVEAAQWMQEEYVEKMFEGQVLTDFDQRAPMFADALFTLDQVMTAPSLAEKIGNLVQLYGHFDWAQLDRFSYVEHEGDVIVTSNSYNIQNSQNVVINSTLTDTILTAGAMPVADEAQKKELQDLLQKLKDELPQAAIEKSAEAEAVAAQAKGLVEEAAKPQPNKPMLQMFGQGLKSTATFLKDTVPAVVTIAGQITSLIGKIHGIGL
jgi:hypothetical protein